MKCVEGKPIAKTLCLLLLVCVNMVLTCNAEEQFS